MSKKGQFPQFQLSICSEYDASKNKDYNKNKVRDGWILNQFNWQKDVVVDLTTTKGISCSEFSNGSKLKDSWVSTHCLMLDFDDGKMNKVNLFLKQNIFNCNSYVFSSQNHQKPKDKEPACDRLRWLIPLKTPITDSRYHEALKEKIVHDYPSIDRTCFELNRYFAHGTTEVSSFVGDKDFFDWESLNLSLEKKSSKTVKFNKKEETLIQPDTEVKDQYGVMHKIKDIEPGIPIYCPICGDSSERTNDGHNAVIKINDDGYPFLFCSSCKSRGNGRDGVYNIDKIEYFIDHAKSKDTMIFIDTINSKIYGGCIEPGNPEFVWRELKGGAYVSQFCLYHDLPKIEIYPRARYELRFDSDKRYDFEQGYVNKYDAPDVLKTAIPDGHTAKLPDVIDDVINHVVDSDLEIKTHFYNDLAYFVQKRQKMITSYLFQGTEGTGKGFMFDNILKPIFGSNYCSQTDMSAFSKEFNTHLTDNVLVLVNEVAADFMGNEGKNNMVIEKIKQSITDINIQIEGKGKDRVNSKNVCSFLFATNKHNGVKLSKGDRRFNVAPRQEEKIHDQHWWTGYDNMKQVIKDNLQEFVWYLKQFSVDVNRIGKVIDNEPKRLLQSLTMSKDEEFFDAFKRCDDEWFLNNIDNRIRIAGLYPNNIIKNMDHNKGISYENLYKVYMNIMGVNIQKRDFGKIAICFIGKPKSVRINIGSVYGYKYSTK